MNQQPRIPKNKIILIAISTKWLDINPKLTHFIEQTGCNIDECSMSLKGNMAMMSMCLSGSWDSLAKLDARLPGFIQHEDIQILTERIATLDLEDDCAPYFMQAVARDKPGLLTQFNQFFHEESISIIELDQSLYQPLYAHQPMININMRILVPAEMNIASLRERFFVFCDKHNIDAALEPQKS